jgi:hypothetical protein
MPMSVTPQTDIRTHEELSEFNELASGMVFAA